MTPKQLRMLFIFLFAKIALFAGISWYASKQLQQIDETKLKAAGLKRLPDGSIVNANL